MSTPWLIAFMFLSMGCAAPLLGLALWVHRLGSAYTRLLLAALLLQLIPIGLVFFPLGFAGVALLGYALGATLRRNARFRRSGLANPDVHRRWTHEAIAAALALGFAVQHKALAVAFTQAAAHPATAAAPLGWLAPASLALWSGVAAYCLYEWRAWRSR